MMSMARYGELILPLPIRGEVLFELVNLTVDGVGKESGLTFAGRRVMMIIA